MTHALCMCAKMKNLRAQWWAQSRFLQVLRLGPIHGSNGHQGLPRVSNNLATIHRALNLVLVDELELGMGENLADRAFERASQRLDGEG